MAYTSDAACPVSFCCPANTYQACYESPEDYSETSEAATICTDSEDCDSCDEYACSQQKMLPPTYETCPDSTVIKKQSKCTQKYNNDFRNYYDERNDFMTKKFNDLNLTNEMSNNYKVCPVHSKSSRRKSSDVYTIEETYWAMWKPNNKNSDISMKKKSEPIVPRYDTLHSNRMRSRNSLMKSPMKEVIMSKPDLSNFKQCNNCMKYIEKNKNCYKCNHFQSESIESLNRKHNTINEDDEDAIHEECEFGGLETMDDASDISSVTKSKKSDKSRKSKLSTGSKQSNEDQTKSSDSNKVKKNNYDYLDKFSNSERPPSPPYSDRKENVSDEESSESECIQSCITQDESSRSPPCKQRSSRLCNFREIEEEYSNTKEDENNILGSRQNLDTTIFQVLKDKLRTNSKTFPRIEHEVQNNQKEREINIELDNKSGNEHLNDGGDVEAKRNVLQTPNKNVEETNNMLQTPNKNVEERKNVPYTPNKNVDEKNNVLQTPNKNAEENKAAASRSSPKNTVEIHNKTLENVNTYNVTKPPEIIVTKPPADDFEVLSNPVDENELNSINYNNIQELEVITLKHTNSYIRKMSKVDEPAKYHNQPGTLKLASTNRLNVIRPHSYPLKPILKKDKKFVPTSRPPSNTKNFSFKYKQ